MNIPKTELDSLPAIVQNLFIKWSEFLYDRVVFNRPQSTIHAAPHCERVLLFALITGHRVFGDDHTALTALAHAAVFHDTRRFDDNLDTGHGARASVYYRSFCDSEPDIDFMPEAALMMKYHDIEDLRGKNGIKNEYHGSLPKMLKLYDIFKDADALDRWRLGPYGLNPRYLRTAPAQSMPQYSLHILQKTLDD